MPSDSHPHIFEKLTSYRFASLHHPFELFILVQTEGVIPAFERTTYLDPRPNDPLEPIAFPLVAALLVTQLRMLLATVLWKQFDGDVETPNSSLSLR